MLRRSLAIVGLLAAAACWVTPGRAADAPRRIVSLDLCTDQLLIDLVPRERIAAVTFMAAHANLSAIPEQGARHSHHAWRRRGCAAARSRSDPGGAVRRARHRRPAAASRPTRRDRAAAAGARGRARGRCDGGGGGGRDGQGRGADRRFRPAAFGSRPERGRSAAGRRDLPDRRIGVGPRQSRRCGAGGRRFPQRGHRLSSDARRPGAAGVVVGRSARSAGAVQCAW